MEAMLQWGLACIRLVQSWASPPITMLMKTITSLGSAETYGLLFLLFYWCIDEKKSLRLGIALLVSAWINLALKFLLDQPRPFFESYDPSVGMIAETLGGFPSGHAQNSLVMWMIVASWGKKRWHFALAALFCLLVGFSRIYLGVHFPTDVFGGWLLGGLVLCGYFLAAPRIESLLAVGSPRAGMIASAALAFAMILYRPSTELLVPAGLILGLGAGYSLNRQRIGFAASAVFGRTGTMKYLTLLARFVLGMAGMLALIMASGKIDSIFSASENYPLIVFISCVMLTLWVSAGTPWLFCRIRLAGDDPCNNQEGT